ncbi:MAG: MlaD family protein [Planctomycetota bacterium]|nr:MlaD family protein [Planctomycetota bacterium]
MDDKLILFRLGILVLSTILVAATLILYLGRGFQPTYRLYLVCEEAPNVTPETPVHRNGVLIGRVDTVETIDEGGVRMTLRINKGVRLFSDEIARIGMTSILGESVIEFVPGRGKRERNLLVDKSRLGEDSVEVMLGPMDILEQAVSVISGLDELRGSFVQAADEVADTSKKIGDIAKSVQSALGDTPEKHLEDFFKNIRQLTEKTGDTLSAYELLAKDVRDVIGQESTKNTLKSVIQKIPEVIERADQLLSSSGTAIKDFQSVARNANDRLKEIGEITKPLAEDKFVDSLRDSLDGIGEFLSSVKESKGTIGLLLNDPSVYNRMNSSLRRIESITYKLEPILRDVRTFSSKIATDPRQLGVKGALDRRPAGAGVKGTFLTPQIQDIETWNPRPWFK